MAESYQCRPSDIMELNNPYERFCFDEACFYIKSQIALKKQPRFNDNKNNSSANNLLKTGFK